MQKTSKYTWFVAFSGLLGGALLMTPNFYPRLAPLQAVALLPVLWGLSLEKVGKRHALTAGALMGLAHAAPQIIALQLPPSISLILLATVATTMGVFCGGAWILMRGPAVTGAFGVGALLALLDWLQFTVVPIWGTAQSVVRPWSFHPDFIQFVSFTGITGVAFFLGSFQALLINMFRRPRRGARLMAGALILLLAFASLNIITKRRALSGSIKMAAIGWNSASLEKVGGIRSEAGFETHFAAPAAKAAASGARLLVSPELGFHFGNFHFINRGDNDWFEEGRKEWFDKFRETARKNSLFLAIGYYHGYSQENRLLFMNPEGEIVDEYTKTHLIPFSQFKRGDGRLAMVQIDGVRVGGMICHDDNFTDLSRKYGQNKASVMSTPTMDWAQIKDAHFQNSIHRSIESGYATIRAATNGISAIISP
ncbi:MAG: hypothetical protein GY859_22935, partial [Desulfobacterales bacterium]|nr:hypothetical protein [Desulfobacterales bacterium]